MSGRRVRIWRDLIEDTAVDEQWAADLDGQCDRIAGSTVDDPFAGVRDQHQRREERVFAQCVDDHAVQPGFERDEDAADQVVGEWPARLLGAQLPTDLERLVVSDHDREGPRPSLLAEEDVLRLVLLLQNDLRQFDFDEVLVRCHLCPCKALRASLRRTIVAAMSSESEVGDGTCLAEVTRGSFVESVHRGDVVVVRGDASREEVWTLPGSDVSRTIVCRSAVKSLQLLPLLEHGGAEVRELTDTDVALMAASHEGTERHTSAVADLLNRLGFGEDDLCCGPHAPFDGETRRSMLRRGERPGRLHNNCSGKHAGFLLLARALGVPIDRAVDPSAESQQSVLRTVAEFTGVAAESIGKATDGCGAPTFALPLVGLARAFRQLMLTAIGGEMNSPPPADVRVAACARILRALQTQPFFAAGEGRLCTELLRAYPGRVWPKNGAEGVYSWAMRTPSGEVVAVAVKVSDGATRGYLPLVVHLVESLLGGSEQPSLDLFREVAIRNTLGTDVGRVRLAPQARVESLIPVTA